jgi:hypothetical protein
MSCKVDTLIEEYALDEVEARFDSTNERLLARWTGADGGSAVGYRPLTEWFNQRLLRTLYEREGRETLGVRVEADYDVLTGDDDLLREELADDLAADGIDAAAVQSALVSYGTMRTHLLECLDGKKDSSSTEPWERETIRRAREFASEKVESALSSLDTKGQLAGVDRSSVQVQVHLQCEDCPTRVPLDVALDRGYVCEQHSQRVTEN